MPVLLIGGSCDPYLGWNDLTETFQRLPQQERSRLKKIEGVFHIMMLEKPYYRQFQEAVLLFLRE